ncbi:Cell division control protein 48 C, partial [Cladochytrium tenue]
MVVVVVFEASPASLSPTCNAAATTRTAAGLLGVPACLDRFYLRLGPANVGLVVAVHVRPPNRLGAQLAAATANAAGAAGGGGAFLLLPPALFRAAVARGIDGDGMAAVTAAAAGPAQPRTGATTGVVVPVTPVAAAALPVCRTVAVHVRRSARDGGGWCVTRPTAAGPVAPSGWLRQCLAGSAVAVGGSTAELPPRPGVAGVSCRVVPSLDRLSLASSSTSTAVVVDGGFGYVRLADDCVVTEVLESDVAAAAVVEVPAQDCPAEPTMLGVPAEVLGPPFASLQALLRDVGNKRSMRSRSIVLAGPPGSGKTLLVEKLCQSTEAERVVLRIGELFILSKAERRRHFKDVLARVQASGWLVVVFDKLDTMFRSRAYDDDVDGVTLDLVMLLSKLHTLLTRSRTLLIGTTSNLDACCKTTLTKFFKDFSACVELAGRCQSLELAGIARLCDMIRRGTSDAVALSKLVSATHNSIVTDSVSWDQVAGLDRVKGLLKSVIEQMVDDPRGDYTDTLPKSILLKRFPSEHFMVLRCSYGPPGSGKTLLAKAVASHERIRFISRSLAQILRGEIGESEKLLSSAFADARRSRPSVLFLDEIDALFTSRDAMEDYGQTLFSQLVQELDAIEPGNGVLVLAATNHRSLLDPALLRP